MGKQVIDITKPWKRPNPIVGDSVPVFMAKRHPVKNLGKGKVVHGVPWMEIGENDERSDKKQQG